MAKRKPARKASKRKKPAKKKRSADELILKPILRGIRRVVKGK